MNKPTKKPKAIILDVDETLTDRVTWYELTEKLGGSTYQHADLFMKYLEGKISYQTVKSELFKIWNTNGPVSKSQLLEIFQNIQIKGEAVSLLRNLQDHGYELCLISGSIQMFIEKLGERLDIKHTYGNSRLIFDQNDIWTNLEYTKEESQLKVEQFHHFLEKTGYKPEECIAIGDGENDIDLFREIPGIAINSRSEHLQELAWRSVKYLPRISQVLEGLK